MYGVPALGSDIAIKSMIIHKEAFTHTRGTSPRLALPLGWWARWGDVRLASPRICMNGLASRSGATTIQSHSRVKKHNHVSCRLASPMCAWLHYERIAQSSKRCRVAPPHLASPRCSISTLLHSHALTSAGRHRLASPCVCVNPFIVMGWKLKQGEFEFYSCVQTKEMYWSIWCRFPQKTYLIVTLTVVRFTKVPLFLLPVNMLWFSARACPLKSIPCTRLNSIYHHLSGPNAASNTSCRLLVLSSHTDQESGKS